MGVAEAIASTNNGPQLDAGVLVRAARQLLSSVTRVLLLADRVQVKQILKAQDKVHTLAQTLLSSICTSFLSVGFVQVAYSLTRLENTNNFTEFVKIFTQFGGEMVDLAHRSGERQHVSF